MLAYYDLLSLSLNYFSLTSSLAVIPVTVSFLPFFPFSFVLFSSYCPVPLPDNVSACVSPTPMRPRLVCLGDPLLSLCVCVSMSSFAPSPIFPQCGLLSREKSPLIHIY
ncbi:uncharacterized protein RJT20DRAFT_51457 [Scheffersomyces xylosifermentans]|uniref:uncharacterized protein n=1 Tax=Scheffersomyces xylosifermentans TaxID=1304137 RepID=UPI00315C528A